jgi:hypothetical protein
MNMAIRAKKSGLIARTVSSVDKLPLQILWAMALDGSLCKTDGTVNKKMEVLPLIFPLPSRERVRVRGIGGAKGSLPLTPPPLPSREREPKVKILPATASIWTLRPARDRGLGNPKTLQKGLFSVLTGREWEKDQQRRMEETRWFGGAERGKDQQGPPKLSSEKRKMETKGGVIPVRLYLSTTKLSISAASYFVPNVRKSASRMSS